MKKFILMLMLISIVITSVLPLYVVTYAASEDVTNLENQLNGKIGYEWDGKNYTVRVNISDLPAGWDIDYENGYFINDNRRYSLSVKAKTNTGFDYTAELKGVTDEYAYFYAGYQFYVTENVYPISGIDPALIQSPIISYDLRIQYWGRW